MTQVKKTTYTEELEKIAVNHGFDCYVANNELTVLVPWVNSKTGQKGIDYMTAKNTNELFAILGY